MKIALAQYGTVESRAANLGKALSFIREARAASADLVLYPELCLSPFFPQFRAHNVDAYVNELTDHCIGDLRASCRELGIAAVPNVYLSDGGRLFDASIFIDSDGAIQGVSKMVHIAQQEGFYEQDYYAPSDTGFKVYDSAFGKFGIVVCFDRHYPESIRTCVLRGASVILIPTANTIDEPSDIFTCELRAAAYQNGVYVAMCNRVGTERRTTFCGESMVVDPHGELVAKSGAAEGLVVAEIDLAQVKRARAKRPYLSLRNPDVYERGEKDPRGSV